MSAPIDLEALLPKGTVLCDKYEVVRVLGRGGMGVVVQAKHLRMNRNVALKILLPAFREDKDVVARFEREARAASQLTDVHVTRVLDVDTLPDGSPFMVMELLRGNDLSDILAARKRLPYREAVGFLLEACAGIADAHRAGVVHRDLKPNNLFLDRQGPRPVLKILDFGISKIQGDVNASMTATSTTFGTPLYMSPEQVRSMKTVDARTDIWSLGVVLYELLAGEPPFQAPSATAILAAIIADQPVPIAERVPDVPGPLAEAVMRALEKDVRLRFQDVQSFAAAIAPYAPDDAMPLSMPPASMLPGGGGAGPLSRVELRTAQPASLVGTSLSHAGSSKPALSIAAGMFLAVLVGASLLFAAAHKKRPDHGVVADPGPTALPTLTAVTTQPTVVPVEPSVTASASATGTTASVPTGVPTGPHAPRTTVAPVDTARPTPSVKPVVTAPQVTKPPPPPDDPKYL